MLREQARKLRAPLSLRTSEATLTPANPLSDRGRALDQEVEWQRASVRLDSRRTGKEDPGGFRIDSSAFGVPRIFRGTFAPRVLSFGSALAGPSEGLARLRRYHSRRMSCPAPTTRWLARSRAFHVVTCPVNLILPPCDTGEFDVAVEPIDRLYGERRDQNALSKPPIASVDDEIVDAPVGIVDHEILDMANFAIDGVNTVSSHFDDAAQMRIGSPQSRAFAASLGFVGWTETHVGRRHQGRSHRAGDRGEIGAAPKRVPTVVGVELILHLLRDRLILSQFRAAF